MRQLIRYGLVGAASNLAMYLLYLLITWLWLAPKQAMTLVYLAGAAIGYAGHRQWTFMHRGGMLGSGARYVIAHLLGYLLNFLILLAFVDRLGYPHQWVQAAAILVVACFLFLTFKFFVFAQDRIDG